jgi:hypothetical protein
MSDYRTIKIKKYSDVIEEIKSTAVAITPGMLLELDSTNGYVKAHATSGGNAMPMFALEDELQGKEITDNYAVSTLIQVWFPGRGDQVYAILADGNEVDIGSFLESNGAGFLQLHAVDTASSQEAFTSYTNQIVAVALEHKDTSGGSTDSSESPIALGKRIKVRIV